MDEADFTRWIDTIQANPTSEQVTSFFLHKGSDDDIVPPLSTSVHSSTVDLGKCIESDVEVR